MGVLDQSGSQLSDQSGFTPIKAGFPDCSTTLLTQNRFLIEFFCEKFYNHDDQLVLRKKNFSRLKTVKFVNLGLQLLVIISPTIVRLSHLIKG